MNSQLVRKMSSRHWRTRTLRRSEGGYVLIAAMAIMAVLLGTGIAFMRWSTDEAGQAKQTYASIQAYYLAQMGVVEKGFQWLRTRQEGDLPRALVTLPGREVPGYGKYENVEVLLMDRGSEGDFWTQSRWYRISAVGVCSIPFYHDGREERNDVKRRAVLYVKIRSYADYMYLSNYELTNFGDRIKFWHEDTLNGRVQSNSEIAIMENPVFYDVVSTCANDFWHGAGYNPQFRGPDPIFNAQPVEIPQVAENLRAHATISLNPGGTKQQRIRVVGQQITIWTWNIGQAFDSTDPGTTRDDLPLSGPTCIFTEAPLELYGFNIQGSITIGSAQNVRLIDDVRVAGPHSGPPEYRVDSTNTNYVGIVSEGQIKIANTIANGRNNSSGMGSNQNNQALTDIVITAAVVALGESFTFENQNDPDSGYVFCSGGQPGPDDRGTIWLWGSLTQQRRGYVHRSNCNSSGYAKQYRYDKRFLRQRPPCFFEAVDSTGRALFDIVQWGQGKEPRASVPLRYN